MSFSLGRYVPYQSLIHKLDPRVKILSTILMMVCVFMSYKSWAMEALMQGIILVVCIILLALTHTRLSTIFKSLKSLWIMIIFLLLIYTIMPYQNPRMPVAFSVEAWNWTVYWDSFMQAAKILLRLTMMISLTMVLTSSTKPLDLTYALEWYVSPLKVIHFPAHEVAMTISIALRFIPTILEDTQRVMKAQESRGVSFSHGKIGKRLAALTSLIIPLFVSAFMRSDELANAMECRGYDPRGKRTRYRALKWHWKDTFFLLFSAALVAFFIWWAVDPHFNAMLVFPVEVL
ncbi:MAG: energy-coupling factor transporter transmembrane component T [Candidatus Enteromonas sp.]|nr:energy-coupling factor transporter transmembrane protein EcfT [Bacilli bacterium]MEE3427331.1 energy-coupling factor transporter transmembrane component T [Candidatus Enteromonas sp.]